MSRDSSVGAGGRPQHDRRARRAAPGIVPVSSAAATIVATVTAAMCPVLPSATLATSVRTVRVRR